MIIGTIYYLIPDIFKGKFSFRDLWRHCKRGEGVDFVKRCVFNKKTAIGGIKVFYQHVKYSRELGFDAHVLAMGSYDGNIYYPELSSQTLKEVGLNLKSNDIVVATEFSPYDALVLRGINGLFAQSWIYLKKTLEEKDKQKSYRGMGFDYVILCGDFIKETIDKNNKEQCFTISNAIDDKVFFCDPSVRVKNRLIVLPRKNPRDIEKIAQTVKARNSAVNFYYADGSHVQWRCCWVFWSRRTSIHD